MRTFKNISGQELILPGYGIVKAGGTIKVQGNLNNANFEEVAPRSAPPITEKKESK
jgi:hypothetical protein